MDESIEEKNNAVSQDENFVGVSDEIVQEIKHALAENDYEHIEKLVENLHAADTAELIESLNDDERQQFIEIIAPNFDPEILPSLEESVLEDVIDQLGTEEFAAAVSDLETDDAVSLIEELDEDQKEEVLSAVSAEDRARIEQNLSYPEDTAGRLMQREMVLVPEHWTVAQVLDYIHHSTDIPHTFYSAYVIDSEHKPIGSVALSALLRYSRKMQISEIMEKDVKCINALTEQKDVGLIFQHYGLVAAPIINEIGQIIGMVTVDDVVDVIEEEAEREIFQRSGVKRSDIHESIISTSFMRLRWLLLTLANSALASFVISQFQYSLEAKISLAILMPIVAAMGGSAGMQVLTIIVRAIATRELRPTNTFKILTKEVSIAMINGLIIAIILGITAGFWFSDYALGIVLGFSVILNILGSALLGVVLPVILNTFDFDPALGAAPFINTATDIIGYITFLGLAAIFLV